MIQDGELIGQPWRNDKVVRGGGVGLKIDRHEVENSKSIPGIPCPADFAAEVVGGYTKRYRGKGDV